MHLRDADKATLTPPKAGRLFVRAILSVNGSTHSSQGSVFVHPGGVAFRGSSVYWGGSGGAVVGKPAALYVRLADAGGSTVVRSRAC